MYRHNKEEMPHCLLGARNVAAVLYWSYTCCVAAEDTRCQSTVQHIPVQIGGPLRTGLGRGITFQEKIQFGIDNHHSDLLSLVVSVFHNIRLRHVAKLTSLEPRKGARDIYIWISNVFIYSLWRLCVYIYIYSLIIYCFFNLLK